MTELTNVVPAESLKTWVCTLVISAEHTIEAADWDAAWWKAQALAGVLAGDPDVIDVSVSEVTEDHVD